MGLYSSAVDAAAEVFESLPDSWEKLAEESLVWANRSLRERNVEAARALLKQGSSIDALNRWRIDATKALIECANSDVDGCVSGLEGLSADAPARGVSDTRAMGAYLLGSEHQEAAIALLGNDQTAAAAQAAFLLGDAATAARLSPDSFLKSAFGGR